MYDVMLYINGVCCNMGVEMNETLCKYLLNECNIRMMADDQFYLDRSIRPQGSILNLVVMSNALSS